MEIRKLICAAILAVPSGLMGQANWPGVQPGVSARADVNRAAGAQVQAVTETLVEYKGAQAGDRAFVQYRATGIVERVEVLLASPLDRAALLRSLGLNQPEVSKQNARGKTEEFFGAKMIVLTVGDGRVERVAYYSRELFEASGGRQSTGTTSPNDPKPPVPPSITGGRVREPSTPGIGGGPGYSSVITIPVATKITMSLGEKLSTAKNRIGDRFTGTLGESIVVDGETVAPKGAKVEGRITNLLKSGRVKGLGELHLELTGLEVYGFDMVAISTGSYIQQSDSGAGGDAKKAGASTGIGAAVGAVAGGAKGAAIGAGAGAAAAAGAILIMRGKPAELAVETVIGFQLSLPVTVKRRLPQ
jgi:hypothetical protein